MEISFKLECKGILWRISQGLYSFESKDGYMNNPKDSNPTKILHVSFESNKPKWFFDS
jgi:hypothetical protein